jgi:predicted esterase
VDLRQRYRDLNDRVFGLYAAGRPDEALGLIADAGSDLAPWRAELAYLSACLHGSAGRPDAALATLESAAAAGDWWDPSVLDADDDLAEMRGLPGYDALAKASTGRWQRAHEETDRAGDRLVEPAEPARGVLVALHGAEEDAGDAVAAWGSATSSGYAVLAVRSSQRTSPNYRTWPDQDRAVAELSEAVELLAPRLRALPVVAAGFSAGGRVALAWALSGRPSPVAGVLAVAPAIALDALPTEPATGLDPARILVGAEDDLLDDVSAVGERLRPSGFGLDVVPGLGHSFPADFSDRLADWLSPAGLRR